MIFLKKYSDIQITTRRETFFKSFSEGTNDIACDHLFLQGNRVSFSLWLMFILLGMPRVLSCLEGELD